MLLKQNLSLPRNLALGTFGDLLILFSTKVSLVYLEVLSSASDKAKLFAKNLSKNSSLDDSDIFLPVFPLKLHNISITPKWLKRS